jgi:predicted phosphodiesterase/DNA-binding CsgD family transcriptional regulator
MTQNTPDLSARQREFLAQLPASTSDIADAMGVAETTVEGYRNKLRDKGIDLRYDREANRWYIADERAPKLRRISTKHKATKTREANTLIESEESILLRRLERTEPTAVPAREHPSEETFCAVLGDLHFGDLVEADDGTVLYDIDEARRAVRTFTDQLLKIREMQSELVDFDDCYLFLLGDIATGMAVYEGQHHDIEAHLADQVTEAVQTLYQLVVTLADAFETVQVRCVLGNHGTDRAAASRGANTDLIAYRWLDDALRRSPASNIDIDIAEATHHMNCQVRDWRFHVRHGQDGQRHVDKTAASSRDWRGWREKHRYDVALRGHWHDPSVDYVLSRYPVITAPSPKPGAEFIERMGHPDVSQRKHLGWVFGTSDDRRTTFEYLIDDQ